MWVWEPIASTALLTNTSLIIKNKSVILIIFSWLSLIIIQLPATETIPKGKSPICRHNRVVVSSIKQKQHFVYVPSQWKTTLHCNVVSHWLGAYTKWSLQHMYSAHTNTPRKANIVNKILYLTLWGLNKNGLNFFLIFSNTFPLNITLYFD